MAFLTDSDYESQIKTNILNQILEGNLSHRANAELKAQSQMTSALNVRYDVPAIFAATGDGRNPEVVMYMVDITLYHLHSRINPGQVPEERKTRYEDALTWLKMVASGKLEPLLPIPAGSDQEVKYDVKFGSRKARDPYY